MAVTALLLGLAGSLHCVGMCSPLLLAVTARRSALGTRVVYNAGRISMYGILGAGAGLSGYIISNEIQNLISIFIGLGLMLMGVLGVTVLRLPLVTALMSRLASLLRRSFALQVHRKNWLSFVLMGVLNALLPCGLTFVALSACLILPGPEQGFFFMILFGLGTLPAMLGTPFVIQLFTKSFRVSPARLTLSLLFISGGLLIGRVLIAELPHSPSLQAGLVDIMLCR
jgi:hypothetical protein